MFFRKAVWSPIEIEYLKAHREDTSVEQLSIALAKSRAAIKNKKDELDGKIIPGKMSKRSKIGKRQDLGQFFRSGWEANFCRWLNSQGIKWEYEPKIFHFDGVKHGTVSYLPDLRITDRGQYCWLEVKGLLDKRGATALRRFKKSYPEEFSKLRAVVGRKGTKAEKFFKELGVPIYAYMNELDKACKGIIPNWE